MNMMFIAGTETIRGERLEPDTVILCALVAIGTAEIDTWGYQRCNLVLIMTEKLLIGAMDSVVAV